MIDFKECAACAAEGGSPLLCASCLHNRGTIAELTAERRWARCRSGTTYLLLGIVAAATILLLHFLTLYGREAGCREAGGKPMRSAFGLTCSKPITISRATHERLDAFLAFAHGWLAAISKTPDNGTPQLTAGLEQARLRAAEAATLRKELAK